LEKTGEVQAPTVILPRNEPHILVGWTTEPVWIRKSENYPLYRESNSDSSVRFEVFTAVTMKNAVFWDVTPCGSC
jgi:hypothetical protein